MIHESNYYHRYDEKLCQAKQLGFLSVDTAFQSLYLDKEFSLNQIAILFQVSYQTIRKHLVRLNVPRRSRGGVNNQKGYLSTKREILYDVDGIPLTHYCRTYTLPYKTVWNRIHNLGWTVDEAVNTPIRRKSTT